MHVDSKKVVQTCNSNLKELLPETTSYLDSLIHNIY